MKAGGHLERRDYQDCIDGTTDVPDSIGPNLPHGATRTEPRSAVARRGLQIHSNQLPAAFGVKKEIRDEKQN